VDNNLTTELVEPVPDIDDSELSLGTNTEAEVLGQQAYLLVVEYNKLSMTAKATKSVNGNQYDSIMHELARIRNQIAYIYNHNPKAKLVKERIARNDEKKFSQSAHGV